MAEIPNLVSCEVHMGVAGPLATHVDPSCTKFCQNQHFEEVDLQKKKKYMIFMEQNCENDCFEQIILISRKKGRCIVLGTKSAKLTAQKKLISKKQKMFQQIRGRRVLLGFS